MEFYDSKIETLVKHGHSAQKVYPTAADPVTLTSGGGAWTLGAETEIVPASTITDIFDIHWVVFSNPNTNEDYELVLYYGDSDIECARVSFTRTGVFTGSIQAHTQTPLIPANSTITGKLMDGTGGATVQVKIVYHTY